MEMTGICGSLLIGSARYFHHKTEARTDSMSYREHKTDYFRDEVRYGFYIPAAIKQAWAAEMDVLPR